LAACLCARLSLQYVTAGERRPLVAIETAERWARQESGVSLADVQDAAWAADAARAAAWAAWDARAADAAGAAARTADAAWAAADAARAARAAAWAAWAAGDAAGAAAGAAAYADVRTETLAACADIVRKYYPTCPQGRKVAKQAARPESSKTGQ
jgi:hypothetical protein